MHDVMEEEMVAAEVEEEMVEEKVEEKVAGGGTVVEEVVMAVEKVVMAVEVPKEYSR